MHLEVVNRFKMVHPTYLEAKCGRGGSEMRLCSLLISYAERGEDVI